MLSFIFFFHEKGIASVSPCSGLYFIKTFLILILIFNYLEKVEKTLFYGSIITFSKHHLTFCERIALRHIRQTRGASVLLGALPCPLGHVVATNDIGYIADFRLTQ